MSSAPPVSRPAIVLLLLPFALGYGVSYFFRNLNAVAGPAIAQEFSLDPSQLGLLTAAYFLTFSASQIPLGMLIDRFGPARVNGVMILFAAAGALCFALGTSATALFIGRALIGLGVAVTLMASMSAVHAWAPPERVASYTGIITAVGGLGAIFASTPSQLAINAFGWRHVFLGMIGVSLVAALAIFSTRAHSGGAAHAATPRELAAGVKTVFTTPYFWRMGLAVAFCLGSFLAFQTLWAATWMRDVAGYTDKLAISNVLFGLNVGMTIAFVFGGIVADQLAERGIARIWFVRGVILLAISAQLWIMLWPRFLPHVAWGVFAMGANSLVIAYSVLAKTFAPNLTGRVNTGLNLLAFGMAFLLQWVIGIVLTWWPAVQTRYAAEGYYWAWGILVVLQMVMLLRLTTPPSTITKPASPTDRPVGARV